MAHLRRAGRNGRRKVLCEGARTAVLDYTASPGTSTFHQEKKESSGAAELEFLEWLPASGAQSGELKTAVDLARAWS